MNVKDFMVDDKDSLFTNYGVSCGTFFLESPSSFSMERPLLLRYSFVNSPIGTLQVCRSNRGICRIGMAVPKISADGEANLNRNAVIQIEEDSYWAQSLMNDFFLGVKPSVPYSFHLIGTSFQHAVWQGLIRIPRGKVCSYFQLARIINQPSAVRAVAHAVGQNPIMLLLPCHRIVHSDGDVGNYHYGVDMKYALLRRELFF